MAIKVVQETSGKAQQEMLGEAGLMASMRHPHLLRLVGVCLSDGLQLITPLRPLGNLLEFVQKHKQKLGSLELMRYCQQIASVRLSIIVNIKELHSTHLQAMEYLEQHRLVHRDLACRNVLVKTSFHVEVTDFGLAKMLDYGESEVYVEGKVSNDLFYTALYVRAYSGSSKVAGVGMPAGASFYSRIGRMGVRCDRVGDSDVRTESLSWRAINPNQRLLEER